MSWLWGEQKKIPHSGQLWVWLAEAESGIGIADLGRHKSTTLQRNN